MLTYADYADGRADGAGRGVWAAGAAGVSARCRRSVRSHYAGTTQFTCFTGTKKQLVCQLVVVVACAVTMQVSS
jgi:hypothetical protein